MSSARKYVWAHQNVTACTRRRPISDMNGEREYGRKERDYRRVKRGTTVDGVLKSRDPMFSPDDPNQIMRGTKRKPAPYTVDPSMSIPPSPQDQSGLTKEVRQKVEALYPFIVIAGTKPPTNPITINNLIVGVYDEIQHFRYAPGKGGNPAIKDPMAKELPYSHSSFPRFDALDVIINVLGDTLGIEICPLAVYLYVLVVEASEKDYDLHKLPCKVAGRSTLWCRKGDTWDKKLADSPHKKAPSDDDVADDSNYNDCACVGFFSEYDGINVLVHTVDHLIEKGWDIVKD